MLLSNKLTYCITAFILLAFVALPVMAHEPGAGYDANHDGLDADGDPLTGAALLVETGHTHSAAPTIMSITAVDTKGSPPGTATPSATTLVSNVDGMNIVLVNDTTAADDARLVIALADADTSDATDDSLDTGGFVLKITFSEDVYPVAAAGTAADAAPTVAETDVFTGVSFVAAAADAAGVNIGSIFSLGTLTRVETVEADTTAGTPAEYSLREFLVPVTISETNARTLTEMRLPVSLWVNVAANQVYSLTQLNGPNVVQGRGNAEYVTTDPFMLNGYVAPGPGDPVLQSIVAARTEDADGEVTATFTITFDKANPSFTLGDITVGNGIPTALSPNADNTVWTLVADAIDDTAAVTATVGTTTASTDGDPSTIPGIDLRVIPPTAPNADGDLVFTITSNLALTPPLTIGDFDIDTREVDELASGDLVMDEGTLPTGVAERYMLTVTPKVGVTSVLVELRAGASMYMRDHDNDPETDPISTPTPTREGHYTPETEKPTIGDIMAVNLDDSMLAATPGDIDSVDGGTITVSASDVVDGDLTSQIGITTNPDTSEVKVSGGSITAVNGASFTLIPDLGAITVTVTVIKGAVADNAGNMNDAKSQKFTVGPIFNIPADTILVIHKTEGATYQYLSDQPRLPINQQPPTPAPNIATDIWHNMPDLEVLFSIKTSGTNQNFGGTLNLTEADGQTDPAELPQTRDGGDNQRNSVRISEVMWASDLALRGGINDDEAAEQWIEISNDTGKTVRVFLFARTGLDSARNVDDVEDRVGNAYNGSPGSGVWTVPGQNGNSHTGGTAGNFISMHRKWDGHNNRGYVNGTGSGNWSASDRRYLTSTAFPNIPQGEAPYDFVGSPGRPHSINLPKPSTRAAVTAIPGSKVAEDEKLLINEVSNRVDARYEWIELRNYGNQPADLRSFRISKVTAVDEDQALIDLAHNESYKIPVGGVLLLVATDPRYDDDHPLAVGYNIDVNENDQVAGIGLIEDDSPRKAATARYKVVNFQNGGLDDDGEFILIVRSPDDNKGDGNHGDGGKGRAELGTADLDRISDIAGYHPDLVGPDNYPATNPPNLNKTQLWPLVNFSGDMKPREENRGNRTNRLEAGKVRYRQHVSTTAKNNADGGTPGNRAGTGVTHKDEKTEHYAFRDAGYTGWGYKRTARRDLRVHNGTPGYHGNIRNTTTNTDTADATVYISEIMYSTGGEDTSLPQWVELYNSSATQAVHLGSGWKLMIEELDADGNPKDKLVAINFKDQGRVKHIYPQQTVLIAAGNARQSGSDNQPSRIVFPDNRVFNVYRDIGAGKLGGDDGTNTRYQFFNPTAFALVLVDKDGKVADMVGNLDGDARTSDTVAEGMEIPEAISVDPRTNISNRTSIIRVHDDGVARDGMLPVMPLFKEGGIRVNSDDVDPKWGWIPAVNTEREFKITIKSTWYGDEDDYGTPGHRPGLVLPVELSHFRPTLEDGKVTIRWTTESELDNAGFNILRSDTRNGEYKQVNAELIEGAGTTGERNTYKWVDQTAKPNVVYYYQIEDVSFAGERQALAITKLKGLISAQNKLTTTWSELKASQ